MTNTSTSLTDLARPERCALVVYDMQAGILSQLADGAAVLERVLGALEAARTAGMPVIFLRHMSLPVKLMGTFQMRQAMTWQRTDDPGAVKPWFLRGSPAHALAPELAPREDEAIFDKLGMSAFEGTPLAMTLRDLGLVSFAICGVATEIGIYPSVRHGSDLGLIPIVIEEACGHGSAEAGARSLANMRHMGDAIMTDVSGWKAALEA
ncbi:cysteine hydrolase family protein [Pontivivens ytuae]|uniref:Cysteine hydrolase n=1 Tax=Pontivivens ytuae TaxID=2789856 RepID=A0A7S9LUC2_9RHOB|nr:cysteine hydrolase [Pontivivens ytuae]QPH55419.1 cysteine hydrolase [Pontivivens ytuae]